MPLKKTIDGIQERENFFLSCPFEDFLGNATYSRTLEYFELKTGEIKRRFPPLSSFVIDIKKDPTQLEDGDEFDFFVENEYGQVGIKETAGSEAVTNWRLIFHDGFIQSYSSTDGGTTWKSAGGREFLGGRMLYQGFRQKGNKSLVLRDYKIFKSPILTIQNFAPDFTAKLYKENGELVRQRTFGEDLTARIFMDYAIKGYLVVEDLEGKEVFRSPIMDFERGDTFLYTQYFLSLLYGGKVLDYKPTMLNEYSSFFILRNDDTEAYNSVNLRTVENTADTVEISLDGVNFGTFQQLDRIEPLEEKKVYFKITKNEPSGNPFNVKDFTLEIF